MILPKYSWPLPKENKATYDVIRKNKVIGSIETIFNNQDSILEITTVVDIEVKVLFVTAYEFYQTSKETWVDNEFIKIEAYADFEDEREYFIKGEDIDNIFKLTKKLFIITTPNRSYPVDFHTKIPFLHWLPKKVHRKILRFFGMSFFSKEENLNLLSRNDVHGYLRKYPLDYKIIDLKFLGLSSNFIIIGKIKN